jgi:anti-sigma-K factor RskA
MNDCEQLSELIPAYSIGATDEDETRQVEDGLKRCPELVMELNRYTEMTDLFAHTLPPMTPPAEMLGELLINAKKLRPKRIYRIGWAGAAVACLMLILVVSNIYWFTRLNTETVREINFQTALNGEESNAKCRVIWSKKSNDAVLIASNFPLIADDEAYQAWVHRDGSIISLGVFRVDENGNGALTFIADALDQPFDTLGVTIEPVGGSPAPTTPPVMRWQLPS